MAGSDVTLRFKSDFVLIRARNGADQGGTQRINSQHDVPRGCSRLGWTSRAERKLNFRRKV